MPCCSGKTQTTKMSCLIQFRPHLGIEFRLEFELNGRNGSWSGSDTGTFNFGNDDKINCGNIGLIGNHKVTVKLNLSCAETETAVIGGTIKVNFGKFIHNGRLKPTELICYKGGPGCLAIWENIFIVSLGTVSIILHGIKPEDV